MHAARRTAPSMGGSQATEAPRGSDANQRPDDGACLVGGLGCPARPRGARLPASPCRRGERGEERGRGRGEGESLPTGRGHMVLPWAATEQWQPQHARPPPPPAEDSHPGVPGHGVRRETARLCLP